MLFMKNEKVRYIITVVGTTLVVWLSIQFLFPLIIPFIFAYILAAIAKPVVDWLCKKANFHIVAASIIVLVVFTMATLVGGGFVLVKLLSQIKTLISNRYQVEMSFDGWLYGTCESIEGIIGISRTKIFTYINESVIDFANMGKEKLMALFMENSLDMIINSFEFIASFIIMLMTAFIFIKDSKAINKKLKKFIFYDEYKMITEKLAYVFKAYVRAQLVIMSATVMVCFLGLSIMNNPYSLIVGVIIGVMDALPMIGSGVILLPWAIIELLGGDGKSGIILLIIFAICYLVREILEPKLIGKDAGIPPLASLLSIYVGYKIFGLFGVVLGPIAFMIISEIVSGLTKTKC